LSRLYFYTNNYYNTIKITYYHRRFDLSAEVFIGNDFRFITSETGSQSRWRTQLRAR